jgi:hypothetical protein
MRRLTFALGALVLSASASFAQEPFFDRAQPVQYRDYYRPRGYDGPRRYDGGPRRYYGGPRRYDGGPGRYYGGPRRYGMPPGSGYYRGRFDCRRVWRRQVTPWGEVVVRPRVVCPDGRGYF